MSVEFETVDEFLEHHGTKGMRWGVRKESSSGSGSSGSKPRHPSSGKFVSKQKQHKGLTRGEKTALVVGGAVAGVLVARMLLRHRNTKISLMRSAQGLKQAQEFAKTIGKTNLSEMAGKPVVSGLNPFKTPAGLFGVRG